MDKIDLSPTPNSSCYQNCFSFEIWLLLILVIDFYFSFISQESTKITLAPSNADVHIGDNTWMECAASYDPMVDITFVWSLNGQEVDLDKDSTHYESTLVSIRHNHFVCLFSLIRTKCRFIQVKNHALKSDASVVFTGISEMESTVYSKWTLWLQN